MNNSDAASSSDAEPTRSPSGADPDPLDRSTARRLGILWILLLVNVLAFDATTNLLVPVPRAIGQAVTMACLAAAFFLALRLNPMVRVRINVYLVLLSALVVLAFVSSCRLEGGLGSLFRCFRLTAFVATLWMMSRWWRGDLRFARLHLNAVAVVLSTVLLGIMIAPGKAFSGGTDGDNRLIGVLWPIPPTQVGEYAAAAAGLAVLLWLTHAMDGPRAFMIAAPSVAMLVLSETRTALIGLAIGLPLASVTLALTSSRARRAIAVTAASAVLAVLAVPQLLAAYVQRDQSDAALSNLSGRQKVWDALLAQERTPLEQILGTGLSGKTYNGQAIDSTWMSSYNELGLVGVALVAAILLSLLVLVAVRPPSPARRCALFLVIYCAVASYTESGLSDASPYLLHLAVAASLLQRPETVADTSDTDEHQHEEADS